MTEPKKVKALLPWGWLRALAFAAAYLVISFLAAILIGIAILFLSRGDTKPDLNAGAANGITLGLSAITGLVISIALVFVFRKYIDRKSLASLGLATTKRYVGAFAGFFLPIAIIGTGSIILSVTKHLSWTDVYLDGTKIFISFGILAIIAFSEEIVFRGYILNNLMKSFNKWLALILSAVAFTLFHLAVPGIGFLPIINIFLLSLLIGINYIYTKNIWYAVMFHFAWDFFQGPLLGYKVAGTSFESLLQVELRGDSFITGGEFGFAGSMVTTLLLVISIGSIYLAYEKRHRPSLVATDQSGAHTLPRPAL